MKRVANVTVDVKDDAPIVEKSINSDVFPSGLYGIDYGLLGVGGFPVRRITEVAGGWSGGKTTLCCSVMGNCIKAGGYAIFVDAEGCFDSFSTQYLLQFGITLDKIQILAPLFIEEAFKMIQKAVLEVREKDKDIPLVVVYDSLVGVPSKSEWEKEYTDTQTRGAVAQAFSFCLRKFTPFVVQQQICCIFTNQLREDPSGFSKEPEYTPGGNSMEFYSSLRVWLRSVKEDNVGKIDKEDRIKIRGRLKKTKIAAVPLNSTCDEYFILDKGFDMVIDLVAFAISRGYIEQKGGWFYFEENKFQGIENVISFYRQDDNFAKLKSLVDEKLKS